MALTDGEDIVLDERPESFRDRYALRSGGEPVTIAGLPTREVFAGEDDEEDELTDDLRPRLYDFCDLMMANEDHAVLLLLQGLDNAGKGGTIKHVVQAMNPVGVRVSTFQEPDEEEKKEHFLDRIRRGLPDLGQFAVFDRSQYEDALVPDAEEQLSDEQLAERIQEILDFEDELAERGITVVKCFVNISYDEQRARFLRRIRRPDKQWKFSIGDVETRRHWPENMVAYGEILGRTSTEAHPWYVIPADHKWHRNWVIAHILIEVFESFGESYPPLAWDADEMRAMLEPPN